MGGSATMELTLHLADLRATVPPACPPLTNNCTTERSTLRVGFLGLPLVIAKKSAHLFDLLKLWSTLAFRSLPLTGYTQRTYNDAALKKEIEIVKL